MKLHFNKSAKLLIFFIIFSVFINCLFGQTFPVSVKDGKANLVVLNEKPVHIISLGAASTEILYKLGAGSQIAAVSDVCNYPPEATNLPKIGGFGQSSISIETLLAYNPDLVILYSGMQDYLIPSLRKYEIPIYVSDAQSIDDVISDIKNLGILTGYDKKGSELIKEYNDVIKNIQKKNTSTKTAIPKVYWEVWYDPYMSAGGKSFINDVISIAGGKNIFENEAQSYPIVSEETILASNPDIILIPDDIFITTDMVRARKGWNEINAVINKKVILFNADVYTRPGPRIFDAIKEMNKILYE